MPFLNIDDGMGDHRKARAAGNAALGLWLRLACNSARYLTDGFVTKDDAEHYGTPEQVRSLVKAGLLDRVSGGYQLHDYLDWNRSREQIEEARDAAKKRQEAWRKRKRGDNASRNASLTDSGDASETLPTPPHSTPPSKEGSGKAARPKKGGEQPSSNVHPINVPKCPIHSPQPLPCIGCAADEKAGA